MCISTNIIKSKYEKSEDIKKRVKSLKKVLEGKKITIIGHDNIDVDATLSAILMSKVLTFLGIENEFCILEKVKEDDTYDIIMEVFNIDMKKFEKVSESSERYLLLLDHYETIHEGKVIACIDHHPNQAQKEYDFIYSRNSSATAFLIYKIMKEVNFPIGVEEAKMIILTMAVDTAAFRSSKAIPEEVIKAQNLAKEFCLDYDSLEKVAFCLTPIEKLTIEEIISNGQKWYVYNGIKVGSAYVQLYDLPEKEIINNWLEKLFEKRKETKSGLLVFIIFDMKNSITYEYHFTKENIEKFVKKGILSRGKDIMPLIEKQFLNKYL